MERLSAVTAGILLGQFTTQHYQLLWRSIRSWLRSLGFVHIWRLIRDKWQKIGQPKNWPKNLYQIFMVVGDTKLDTMTQFWGGLTMGFWGGKGEEIFLTPHISPLGGQGVLKFLCMTEAYRPHVQTKYRAMEFKRGYGWCFGRNFAILGVAGGAKAAAKQIYMLSLTN